MRKLKFYIALVVILIILTGGVASIIRVYSSFLILKEYIARRIRTVTKIEPAISREVSDRISNSTAVMSVERWYDYVRREKESLPLLDKKKLIESLWKLEGYPQQLPPEYEPSIDKLAEALRAQNIKAKLTFIDRNKNGQFTCFFDDKMRRPLLINFYKTNKNGDKGYVTVIRVYNTFKPLEWLLDDDYDRIDYINAQGRSTAGR